MESWTFEDKEIVNIFDDHVREQLPWYDMITEAVCYIVRNYLTNGGSVVDVGASTGNMIDKLMPLLLERNAYAYAVDKSQSMCNFMDDKFKNNNNVEIICSDVCSYREDIPTAQVYVVFLTMMFIPVHERQTMINQIKDKLLEGGVLIVVDKVCDHSGYFATVLKRLGMYWKIKNGAKMEEIIEKEMSLAGVQIPFNSLMLGTEAKLFFRMGEFAGWVVEK